MPKLTGNITLDIAIRCIVLFHPFNASAISIHNENRGIDGLIRISGHSRSVLPNSKCANIGLDIAKVAAITHEANPDNARIVRMVPPALIGFPLEWEFAEIPNVTISRPSRPKTESNATADSDKKYKPALCSPRTLVIKILTAKEIAAPDPRNAIAANEFLRALRELASIVMIGCDRCPRIEAMGYFAFCVGGARESRLDLSA